MPNAIFFYRISRWLYLHHIPFFPSLIRLFIFIIYGCRIPVEVNIGKKTTFTAKGMGVIFNELTSIGENCKIGHQTKFLGKGPYKYGPKIGNNVFISSGAVIVGPVIIDDNVVISPNAVVTKSVPEGAIVGGVPAKIIGWVKDLDYDIMKNESWKEGYMDYLN